MTNSASQKGQRFISLEKRLGFSFSDYTRLERALTHTSLRKGASDTFHYERLEFLGDRVLGLCIASTLYVAFPKADEGDLSLRLNTLVNGAILAEIAEELGLDQFIRAGSDLKSIAGKRMQGVRADVLEALIACVYLDGGLKAAKDTITKVWGDRIEQAMTARRDSKTALQEWAHAMQLPTPSYREVKRTGPDHEPIFTVEATVDSKEATRGEGRSKRAAEQDAAREMLIREGVWEAE